MSKKLRKMFLLAVGVLILIPGLAFAQGDSVLEFPEIDGWEKGELVKYPVKELGYGITYQSREGGRVSLYVYDGGVKNIPNGADNKIVKAQLKQAENDIKIFEERGIYKNVKKVSGGMVTLGGDEGSVEAQHSNFDMEARGNKLTSDIFIFGRNKQFIKIRATRLKGDGTTPNEAFQGFLAKMDELFAD